MSGTSPSGQSAPAAPLLRLRFHRLLQPQGEEIFELASAGVAQSRLRVLYPESYALATLVTYPYPAFEAVISKERLLRLISCTDVIALRELLEEHDGEIREHWASLVKRTDWGFNEPSLQKLMWESIGWSVRDTPDYKQQLVLLEREWFNQQFRLNQSIWNGSKNRARYADQFLMTLRYAPFLLDLVPKLAEEADRQRVVLLVGTIVMLLEAAEKEGLSND